MKQLVFKTVRSNGDSIYAPGALNVNYKIGETYTFPPELPAFVFKPKSWFKSFEGTYKFRPGTRIGNRVLLCLAKEDDIKETNNNLFAFWECYDNVSFTRQEFIRYLKQPNNEDITNLPSYHLTTTKLTVIGEIFVPLSWHTFEIPKQTNVVITE